MVNFNLFETPIRSGKIRKGVWYHQYRNGNIHIMGELYVYYSIKDAVKKWRNKNPK